MPSVWQQEGIGQYLVVYDDWRQQIEDWKYRGQSELIGSLIKLAAKPNGLDAEICLVPIPQSRWRFAQRGFNQSRQLAGWLAQMTGAQIVDCLVEPWRYQQTHLMATREDRHQAKRAMRSRLRNGELVGRTIWLVDDICTTGLTLHAARDCLAGAGLTVTGYIVLARSILRHGSMRTCRQEDEIGGGLLA